LDSPEKFCPNCQNKNEIEAIVCIHCGASLDENNYSTIKNDEIKVDYSKTPQELQADESTIPNNGIAIFFAEQTKPFVIRTDEEIIIGRRATQQLASLLDLSDFDGYAMGVSRRHAMIRQAKSGYEVIDLSSSNGTWLNGVRLVPNKPYSLPSGSRLRLSRIRLFVFYRAVPEEKKDTLPEK